MFLGFKSISEQIEIERKHRLSNKSGIKFGIRFLDLALSGINNSDVVVLSGRTGCGKTELALNIALENIKNNKKVHYFALEAFTGEIVSRIKYRLLAERFRELKVKIELNYCDFVNGELDITKYEFLIDEKLKSNYENLKVFYREKETTIKDIESQVLAIQAQTDLIIIDHIHYIDFDDNDELRAFKRIMKELNDLAKLLHKPIVLVAHIRKLPVGIKKQLAPDLEEIHGTGDITKIATKVISFSSAYGVKEFGLPSIRPTFFRILKSRYGSKSTEDIIAIQTFDTTKNEYDQTVYLGRLDISGQKWTEIQVQNYPKWMKGE